MHIIARLNIGGAAPYVILLTAAMGPPDYDSQLVCGVVSKTEGDMRYLADEKHVEVAVLPGMAREISPLRDLATIFSLWRMIRRERPDVVHTHTAKAGFVGRIAAWLARTPVIVHTFHGHVFSGYFGPKKTNLYLLLERACARLSTRIITLSETLKRELTDVYSIAQFDRIEIIELGFDLDRLAADEPGDEQSRTFRAYYEIPQDARLVGIVGRLVPIKNHELFLQAAQQVADHLPDAMFIVVGDGERREALSALTRQLGIADRVRFTGWLTDVRPVYKALDTLVLSSDNEGLPVSLIEAMAAGVLVVSTAVGGVSDLLENGRLGAIVPPHDVHQMAEAIIRTLTDPATTQIAVRAQSAVLERYTIERSAARTGELYRRLLNQRGLA